MFLFLFLFLLRIAEDHPSCPLSPVPACPLVNTPLPWVESSQHQHESQELGPSCGLWPLLVVEQYTIVWNMNFAVATCNLMVQEHSFLHYMDDHDCPCREQRAMIMIECQCKRRCQIPAYFLLKNSCSHATIVLHHHDHDSAGTSSTNSFHSWPLPLMISKSYPWCMLK